MDESTVSASDFTTDNESDEADNANTTPKKRRLIRHELSTHEKQSFFKRSFKQEWLSDPNWKEWLREDKSSESKFKCIVCNACLSLSEGKRAITRHAASQKHIERSRATSSQLAVTQLFNKMIQDDELKLKIYDAEIRLSTFFATHNIAISLVDDLLPLLKKICNDKNVVNGMTLGRTKATKIINNVVCRVETDTLVNLLKSKFFSVLVDESTDLTGDKFLCVLIKCIVGSSERTQLLKLIHLNAGDTSAKGIYGKFKEFFEENGIPLKNIIGLSSDNANVMLGANNSFMTHLRSDTKILIILRCTCHSLALIASKACKCLPSTPEDLLRAIASYVSASGKRSHQLLELQEYLINSKKRILKLSTTRWLSMHHCIVRVLDLWNVLELFFLQASFEDNLKQSTFIRDSLNDCETKAYLLFLKFVLEYFNSFNALFQSRDILIHKLAEESRRIFAKLANNFIKPEKYKVNVNCRNPEKQLELERVYLGPECESFIDGLENNTVINIRKRCLAFYITACDEIQQRLPLQDPFFDNLSFVDPSIALDPKANKDITQILTQIEPIYKNSAQIKVELRDLSGHFTDAEKITLKNMPITEFWSHILEVKDFTGKYLFQNIAAVALLILSLPHSNAEAERIFSILNDAKNDKRNRLGPNTLNSLCVVRHNLKSRNLNERSLVLNNDHFEKMKHEFLYK